MMCARIHPLVSILIPVFNRKDYITECIQSALDQTFIDFEIIVVDNASDDGTWEICQQIAATDQRVRIFRNASNIGPVRNWKRCAELATGEFSKVLFSDDLLYPSCLSEMLPKLNDSTVSLVYCAASIGATKDDTTIAYLSGHSSKMSVKTYMDKILCSRAPYSPGAILIRTNDLLKNLRTQFPTSTPRSFESHGAGPDVMISILTANMYLYVESILKPLVYFRHHATSFSVQDSNNQVSKGYRSAISYYLRENHGRQPWLSYLAYSWLQLIKLQQRWTHPRLYIMEYEGVGEMREVFEMLFYAAKHLLYRWTGKSPRFLSC